MVVVIVSQHNYLIVRTVLVQGLACLMRLVNKVFACLAKKNYTSLMFRTVVVLDLVLWVTSVSKGNVAVIHYSILAIKTFAVVSVPVKKMNFVSKEFA